MCFQLSTYAAQSDFKDVLRDAIYCFFLLLNAIIMLVAFFGPKVHVVLFRPSKNNTSAVMGECCLVAAIAAVL